MSKPLWTDEEVKSLKDYQACSLVHPYTGQRKENGDASLLIPTPNGWVEVEGGPVIQTWASSYVLSGDWRADVEELRRKFPSLVE